MSTQDRKELIEHLENTVSPDPDKIKAIVQIVRELLPDANPWPIGADPMIHSTDEVIHMVDKAYPNWAIKLRGRASDVDGHWHCVLRENEERDSDAVIGIGKAPVLAHAVLAAVLRLAELRPPAPAN